MCRRREQTGKGKGKCGEGEEEKGEENRTLATLKEVLGINLSKIPFMERYKKTGGKGGINMEERRRREQNMTWWGFFPVNFFSVESARDRGFLCAFCESTATIRRLSSGAPFQVGFRL